MSGDAFWALRRGMLNEGVDLMGAGGLLSYAHSEADIDHTIAAFQHTIAAMKDEGLL